MLMCMIIMASGEMLKLRILIQRYPYHSMAGDPSTMSHTELIQARLHTSSLTLNHIQALRNRVRENLSFKKKWITFNKLLKSCPPSKHQISKWMLRNCANLLEASYSF